jgi:ubiquinone biosynthesis monooxygenase Coq7
LTAQPTKKPGHLLGDLDKNELINRIIRVDHAGEYGAKRIYEGQLAILGDSNDGDVLREMAVAEERHLETFNKLIVERRVRPTALMPLWQVAGYALGVGTALLGREAAMACTVAIEEVIEEHYADQSAELNKLPDKDAEPVLKKVIDEFREEEVQHRDIALANEAEQAPGYPILSSAIKTGSRLAIWLSERV